MENRFEHNQPEEQGWGAYVTPPRYSGQEQSQTSQTPVRSGLCARVSEILPALVENDGEVRQELATEVYAHLTVCLHCARDFDAMQRVVSMVESLAPPEMPMDFSGIIMRRIQTEMIPAQSRTGPRPTSAASPSVSGEAAAQVTQPTTERTAVKPQVTSRKPLAATVGTATVKSSATSSTQIRTHVNVLERLMAVGVLSAMMVFFLSSSWGRGMLGVNVEVAGAWMSQIQISMASIPGMVLFIRCIAGALTQVGGLLGDAYGDLGSKVVVGLAADTALCAAAYFIYLARNRRGRSSGY